MLEYLEVNIFSPNPLQCIIKRIRKANIEALPRGSDNQLYTVVVISKTLTVNAVNFLQCTSVY